VPIRTCVVSFRDHRQIVHSAEVQADTLYEAVVLAITLFRKDPWVDQIAPGTMLDVEVREPATRHAITLAQVERWIDGGIGTPSDQVRKAKLKMLLVKGERH
jgi:hypothetical protein